MTLREALGIIAFAMLMQLSTVGLLFGLRSISGAEWPVIIVTVIVMSAIAGAVAIVLITALRRYEAKRATAVAMLALTEDERTVIRKLIELGGQEYQDTLTRKLGLSKQKVSALVNNLEQKHAITKTPFHKTNILKLTKEFGGR
jgi:uncharacterized membrane protein